MGAPRKRALLDQGSVLITADNPQVVATPAAGAHEVQPEAVDVGLYLVEPGERFAAENALEHGAGVRPEGDGEATAAHVQGKALERGSVIQDLAQSRAARANHQGEGA